MLDVGDACDTDDTGREEMMDAVNDTKNNEVTSGNVTNETKHWQTLRCTKTSWQQITATDTVLSETTSIDLTHELKPGEK